MRLEKENQIVKEQIYEGNNTTKKVNSLRYPKIQHQLCVV